MPSLSVLEVAHHVGLLRSSVNSTMARTGDGGARVSPMMLPTAKGVGVKPSRMLLETSRSEPPSLSVA